jgi:hypothetical protein
MIHLMQNGKEVEGMSRTPLYLAIFVLGSCVQAQDPWVRKDDGSPPAVGDTSDCRIEAARSASFRYPDQPRQGQSGPSVEDDRRFPAELEFYNQCMTRKGFVRYHQAHSDNQAS